MRQKLIEEATVLFAKHGYDTVTNREIAFEAGITEAMIQKIYPRKEELLHAIFQYIEENVEHYDPSKEDIQYMAQTETPYNILKRFVTSYDLKEDYMRDNVYRLIFKSQYMNEEISRFGYEKILRPPRLNAEKTLVDMMDLKLIPPGDSRAIAEIWNRTSLIFEMISVLHDGLIPKEEYYQQTEFFVDLAVRGVVTVPTEHIVVDWKLRAGRELTTEEMTKKQRIMFAALDLFEKDGYPNVSMGQIAEAAGISAYAIYSKYPGKSAIMRDLVGLLFDTHKSFEESPIFEAFRAGDSDEQIVLEMANSFAPIIRNDVRRLYKVLFKEKYNSDDAKDYLTSIIFDSERKVHEILGELVAAGKVPPLAAEPKLIARAFVFSMYSFTVTSTLKCVDPETNERTRLKVIAFLTSFVLNGFRNGRE